MTQIQPETTVLDVGFWHSVSSFWGPNILFSNAFSTGGSRPILTLRREKLALRLGIGIRF